MKKYLRKLSLAVSLVLVLVGFVATASASAYLHVANAQSYAQSHVWTYFCSGGASCWGYPWATGYYERISDSYVRVTIGANHRSYGICTRTFAVRGSDAGPYITSEGTFPYWVC